MWHTHNSTVVERLCSPEIFNWIAPCKHLTFYCKLGERNLYWLIKSESVWPEFNATLKRNKIKNLVRHCCSLNDQDCTFTGCFPENSQPTSQHSEVLNSKIFFFRWNPRVCWYLAAEIKHHSCRTWWEYERTCGELARQTHCSVVSHTEPTTTATLSHKAKHLFMSEQIGRSSNHLPPPRHRKGIQSRKQNVEMTAKR